MALASKISISRSVGKGGKNQANDVKKIQTRLNELSPPHAKKLKVNGRADISTMNLISTFQWSVVKLRKVDGRVDPNGRTLKHLNAQNSKIAFAKSEAFVQFQIGPVTVIATGASALPFEADMKKEFKGNNINFNLYRRALVDGSIPKMKIFLGTIGRAEDARKLARMFLMMKGWGFSDREMRLVFKAALGMRKSGAALKLMDTLSKPGSSTGKLFAKFAKGAGKAGLLISIIEVVDKFMQGDYLYGATEIYKIGMGKVAPWAGMIEGLQSLVEALLPKNTKNTMLFKVLRAFDPIGLGAVGVDAVTSMALMVIDAIQKGTINMARLDRLVKRMKSGPAKLFAEMGEELGDATFEMSQWKKSDWEYAGKMFPKWIASWFG